MTRDGFRGTACGVTKVKKTVVCLLLWMSVQQISGLYVSQDMMSDIQTIKQYYKLTNEDIYTNKPVISTEELKDSSNEMKMVYMAGVLETFEELIGHMLKKLPTPSPPVAGGKQNPASGSAGSNESEAALGIRQKLMSILEKVQALKKTYYNKEATLLHKLQDLKKIQTANVKIQSKALVELLVLYQEASDLPDNIRMRRRRRRQAKSKTHLRG